MSVGSSETGVTDGCETLCGSCELNLSLMSYAITETNSRTKSVMNIYVYSYMRCLDMIYVYHHYQRFFLEYQGFSYYVNDALMSSSTMLSILNKILRFLF